jgi:hypothetical protein
MTTDVDDELPTTVPNSLTIYAQFLVSKILTSAVYPNVNESNEPLEISTIIQLVQEPSVKDQDFSQSTTVTSKSNEDNTNDANQPSESLLETSNDNTKDHISPEQPIVIEGVIASNESKMNTITSTDGIKFVSKDINDDEKQFSSTTVHDISNDK